MEYFKRRKFSIFPYVVLLIAAFHTIFATTISTSESDVLTPSLSDPEEDDDNCRRLPPNPVRTTVDGEGQLNITDLLRGGSEKFSSFQKTLSNAHSGNVILLLGNMGSGKTTLAQILSTDGSGLEAVKSHEGQLVIVDDDERIGAPSVVSRTLVPELVVATNGNNTTVFYDFPGFDDTRGPEYDLVANYFMSQATQNVARIKMLFLVPYYAVNLGDRLNLKLLVDHATKFVRNLAPFENSTGLVVTKVPNFTSEGKPLKDKQILRSTVGFLNLFNQTLHDKLTKTDNLTQIILSRKIEFMNILLHQNENGTYDRISFSRDPGVCGRLNDSHVVQQSKAQITNLYQNLKYGPVTSQDFGYTLKDETKLQINVYARQVNGEIEKRVTNDMADFQKWYENEKLTGKLDVGVLHATLHADLNQFQRFKESCTENVIKFAKDLRLLWQKVGYSAMPESFKIFMYGQAEYLDFFDRVTESRVQRNLMLWLLPVQNVKQVLGRYLDWYTFLKNLKTKLSSYEVSSNKPRLPSTASSEHVNWLEYLEVHNLTLVDNYVKTLYLSFHGTSHVAHLEEIIRWALEPPHITCFPNGLMQITGNLLNLKDVVSWTGRFQPAECPKATSLVIRAVDVVYLDRMLYAKGRDMSLVIYSKVIKVIGNVNFNFDGEDAQDITPRKAANAIKAGGHGADGLPGRAGGPTGSCLLIAGEIEGAERLTLYAIGGKGGRAQDGGDGKEGKNGGRYPFTEEQDAQVREVYRRIWSGFNAEDGGRGGNGGNGGIGGFGGKTGRVEIFAGNGELVKLVVKNGDQGEGGKGGMGAVGGKGSERMWCNESFVLGRSLGVNCRSSYFRDGAPGSKGKDNSSSVGGLRRPREPRKLVDPRQAHYYQKLFEKMPELLRTL